MREALHAWTETSDEVCPSLRKCNTKCKYVISSLQLCSVPMQYVPFVYKEGLNCDEKRECRISLDWNMEVMTFGLSINSKPFLFSLSLYILVPILVNFGFAVDHARFRSLSLSLSLSLPTCVKGEEKIGDRETRTENGIIIFFFHLAIKS